MNEYLYEISELDTTSITDEEIIIMQRCRIWHNRECREREQNLWRRKLL